MTRRTILDDLPPGALESMQREAFQAGAEAKAREVFWAIVILLVVLNGMGYIDLRG